MTITLDDTRTVKGNMSSRPSWGGAHYAKAAEMARKAPLMFLGSLMMVGLQYMAICAVIAGTIQPSCVSSAQCATGTTEFCTVGQTGRCRLCAERTPCRYRPQQKK